jgi:hypothetical protein
LVARRNKGRGGEERQKDTKKKIGIKQNDIHTHHTAAATLLVNYSREKEKDRTTKEVERKDRKTQKEDRKENKAAFRSVGCCCDFVR